MNVKIKKILKRFIPGVNIEDNIFKLYKKSNKYMRKNNVFLSNYYANKIYKKYSCIISSGAYLKEKVNMPHPIGIVIGAGVKIGENVTIYQNVTLGRKIKDISEYPIIGDNVTIYCNSTIIGNVKIGNNVVIGCNSVVLRDVKDGEIVSGIVK